MRAHPAGEQAAPLILLVDDAEDLRTVLTGVLEAAGFRVVTAANGREALRSVFAERPDLVVLDLGLPDLDGLEVLTRIREMADLPVLVLTARSVDRDKLKGFQLGADNYVTKPFSNAELTARITALLRRAGRSWAAVSVLQDGPLVVNLETQAVTLADAPVTLTPTDWSLLIAFVTHPGQVLSQEQLLELAWKDPLGVGPERVKFAVQRLRRRMGWQPPARSPIESVRGFGYRYRGAGWQAA